MNPGAGEEAAKAAGSFFETMKSQPVVLALIVVIFGLMSLLGYIAHIRAVANADERAQAERERAQFISAVEALAKCK